jgi:hypothetical protein
LANRREAAQTSSRVQPVAKKSCITNLDPPRQQKISNTFIASKQAPAISEVLPVNAVSNLEALEIQITPIRARHLSLRPYPPLRDLHFVMDSQAVRTSTIVAISVGTILTGLVGYAVYFDHKRRSDPEFRRSLKRESKRQAKAQKAEQEASAANARKEIAALVREMNEEGYPSDTEQKEKFFLANMAQGEELISSKFRFY